MDLRSMASELINSVNNRYVSEINGNNRQRHKKAENEFGNSRFLVTEHWSNDARKQEPNLWPRWEIHVRLRERSHVHKSRVPFHSYKCVWKSTAKFPRRFGIAATRNPAFLIASKLSYTFTIQDTLYNTAHGRLDH